MAEFVVGGVVVVAVAGVVAVAVGVGVVVEGVDVVQNKATHNEADMKLELSSELLAIILGTPGPKGLRGIPTVIWGRPGSAKTTLVEAAAESIGDPYITLTPQHDETTYGIVPFVDAECVRTPAHEWTRRFTHRGIVILDDLTSHSGPVQAAQLRLITHRETGSATLGRDVAIVGLANLCSQATNARPLSEAISSRFLHVAADMPWSSVAQYLLDEDTSCARVAQFIEQIHLGWSTVYAQERRRMAGFVVARGSAMNAVDERDDIDAVVCASSRTVELCVRAVAAARVLGALHLIPPLVAGSIGRGHAHAYIEYCAQQNLPSDEELLTTWLPAYGQADIAFVALARLATLAIEDRQVAARYWQVVEHAAKHASEGGAQIPTDVVVPSAKRLAKHGLLPPHGAPSRILREVIL